MSGNPAARVGGAFPETRPPSSLSPWISLHTKSETKWAYEEGECIFIHLEFACLIWGVAYLAHLRHHPGLVFAARETQGHILCPPHASSLNQEMMKGEIRVSNSHNYSDDQITLR